jgi:uncharacterized protein YmfQ (DUF2313 family)
LLSFLLSLYLFPVALLSVPLSFFSAIGAISKRGVLVKGANYIEKLTEIKNILNAVLPDNDNFSATDAANWEKALGLISNSATLLDTRKEAIKRKIQHPGTVKARQHYLYIESQLQAAGFDVFVTENRTFIELVSCICGIVLCGQTTVGNTGANDYEVIANSINDEVFNLGTSDKLPFTFFITGATLFTVADIFLTRKQEFRELVLKLKPAQTVAIVFVNYVSYVIDTYDDFIIDTYNERIWAN